MDAKLKAFFDAIYVFNKADVETEPNEVEKFFNKIIKLDFVTFINSWEYYIVKFEKLLGVEFYDKIFTHNILSICYKKSVQKATKELLQNSIILKYVYGSSAYALKGCSFEILINLIATQKIEESEEILKLLMKNTLCAPSFGKQMVIITDKLFQVFLDKQGNISKKVVLPKKIINLLKTYISKIKGHEKALLEQRLREIQ